MNITHNIGTLYFVILKYKPVYSNLSSIIHLKFSDIFKLPMHCIIAYKLMSNLVSNFKTFWTSESYFIYIYRKSVSVNFLIMERITFEKPCIELFRFLTHK